MFPFQLLATSSCIDAGTPDAGFLNLPETDLAGALRIENTRIDMGAYEFNGTTTVHDKFIRTENLHTYPNPFVQTLSISAPGADVLDSELTITDMHGRLVFQQKMLPENSLIHWNGCDNNGNPVPNGIYLVRLKTAGKTYAGKAIK